MKLQRIAPLATLTGACVVFIILQATAADAGSDACWQDGEQRETIERVTLCGLNDNPYAGDRIASNGPRTSAAAPLELYTDILAEIAGSRRVATPDNAAQA